MTWEHYLFGKTQLFHTPPTPGFVEDVIGQAKIGADKLSNITTEDIIELLDKAGRKWLDKDYAPRLRAIKYMPQITGFSPKMVELGLNELGKLMLRPSLEKILRSELGTVNQGDEWNFNTVLRGYTMTRPLGVLLHVSPGNVFLGAADSLIRGLITKNANILKVSSDDPIFPILFAESLAELDDKGVISSSFAIVTFKGGDKELEDAFKKGCDGVVVWGSGKALSAWQHNSPPTLKVIPYGPRMSFALITSDCLRDSDMRKAAFNMALDACMWEQRGCGSPQFLFLEETDTLLTERFLNCLIASFQDLSEQIPPAELTIDEKIEITRERELAAFGELTGQSQAYYPKGNTNWTILIRHEMVRLGSPLNRTLVIYPYRHFEEVLKAIEPLRPMLQSVGLGCTLQEVDDITYALTKAGVCRITGLGKMHVSMAGAPHDGSFQLEHLVRRVCLESSEPELDFSCTHATQAEDLLKFAVSHSPYYKRALKKETIASLESQPFLTGEDVRRNTPPLSSDLLTADLTGAYIYASGGSTGAPKFSCYSNAEWAEVTDIMAFIYKTAGICATDRVGNLFMAGNLYTSFIAINQALERIGCTNLPIAGNANISQIVSYISLLQPNAIVGLPSIIIQAAEAIKAQGLNITIDKILYGGEHLSLEAVRFLKDTLHASSIMSAGYASVDAGPVGYQCPHCQDNVHHILERYQYVEIVDPQTGAVLPPGKTGEIVVTSRKRRLMPLIRYKTGDLGCIITEPCPCGRQERLFKLKGRTGDVLRVGTVSIYPDSIAAILGKFPQASHLFQIVSDLDGAKDTLEIRTEKNNADDKDVSSEIREAIIADNFEIQDALREGWLAKLSVIMLAPGELPRIERTGKIKLAVDNRSTR